MPFTETPDGAKLNYEMTSLVPPWRRPRGTILMHHGVALNGDAWMDWQADLLAADYLVIRLDMRGFGRSQPTPPGYGLRNHADGIASIDLLVVPTISFRLLYGLLIMDHGRRQILWLGVTARPTAEWIANQLTEACGWEQIPRYLIRDRDGAYGEIFLRRG